MTGLPLIDFSHIQDALYDMLIQQVGQFLYTYFLGSVGKPALGLPASNPPSSLAIWPPVRTAPNSWAASWAWASSEAINRNILVRCDKPGHSSGQLSNRQRHTEGAG